MFYVVQLDSDVFKEKIVVPSIWLDKYNTLCLLPPVMDLAEVETLAKAQCTPKHGWQLHSVSFIQSFDTYSQAKENIKKDKPVMIKLEEEEEEQHHKEVKEKRKRKLPRFLEQYSIEFEDEEQEVLGSTLDNNSMESNLVLDPLIVKIETMDNSNAPESSKQLQLNTVHNKSVHSNFQHQRPRKVIGSDSSTIKRMKFAVVKFITEDDYVAIISSNWVTDDRNSCHYPNNPNVKRLLKKRIKPTSDWKTYPIEILGEYETFGGAKEHLIKVEDASNSDSESDECSSMTRSISSIPSISSTFHSIEPFTVSSQLLPATSYHNGSRNSEIDMHNVDLKGRLRGKCSCGKCDGFLLINKDVMYNGWCIYCNHPPVDHDEIQNESAINTRHSPTDSLQAQSAKKDLYAVEQNPSTSRGISAQHEVQEELLFEEQISYDEELVDSHASVLKPPTNKNSKLSIDFPLPEFSDVLKPLLNGEIQSKKDHSRLSSILKEELISYLNRENLICSGNSTALRWEYRNLGETLAAKYPKMLFDLPSNRQKKIQKDKAPIYGVFLRRLSQRRKMKRLRLKGKNKMKDFQSDVAEFEAIVNSSDDAASELKESLQYNEHMNPMYDCQEFIIGEDSDENSLPLPGCSSKFCSSNNCRFCCAWYIYSCCFSFIIKCTRPINPPPNQGAKRSTLTQKTEMALKELRPQSLSVERKTAAAEKMAEEISNILNSVRSIAESLEKLTKNIINKKD